MKWLDIWDNSDIQLQVEDKELVRTLAVLYLLRIYVKMNYEQRNVNDS